MYLFKTFINAFKLQKQKDEYESAIEAKRKQLEDKRQQLDSLKKQNPQLATMDSKSSLGSNE